MVAIQLISKNRIFFCTTLAMIGDRLKLAPLLWLMPSNEHSGTGRSWDFVKERRIQVVDNPTIKAYRKSYFKH